MAFIPMNNAPTIDALLRRAVAGDQQAAGELFEPFRDRLLRMVRLRMDQRLKGRVDSEDTVQDAYLDAAQQPRRNTPRHRHVRPRRPAAAW
jgi:DNA-directed RNA polymerase specialized sigma24 family protein